MTNEEAIKILESRDILSCGICVQDNNANDDVDEAFKMAIEALEKQIPKAPMYLIYHGDSHFAYCACPVCEKVVDSNYCKNCGQAIDWNED